MPRNVMCKKCTNLANEWCEKVIDSPVPDMPRDCSYFSQKTNGDKIRAMSDEELASFLCNGIYACERHPTCNSCPRNTGVGCMSLSEWIQQPVEDE